MDLILSRPLSIFSFLADWLTPSEAGQGRLTPMDDADDRRAFLSDMADSHGVFSNEFDIQTVMSLYPREF